MGEKGPLELPSGTNAAAAKANSMGIAHYKLGEDEYGHWYTAKDYFEDAIKAEPQRAEPHFNLALTLDKLGEHAEATAEFKKALHWRRGTRRSLDQKPIESMSFRRRALVRTPATGAGTEGSGAPNLGEVTAGSPGTPGIADRH